MAKAPTMSNTSASTPVRYITGENNPFTGVAFPKVGCLPAASQLMSIDETPVAVKASTVSGNTKCLVLNNLNYNSNLLRAGMWLYVAAQNVVVKISHVDIHKKYIYLEKPLATPLAAVDVYLTKFIPARRVEIISSGTVDAIVQGVDLRPGEHVVYEGGGGIAPITYNANTASSEITINIS